MSSIFLALVRTLVSLTRPGIWGLVLAPAFLSLLLWLLLALWGREGLYHWLLGCPPMPLLVSWGAGWLAKALAYIGSWMVIFAFAYFTAALLAAVLVMPWLLDRVAKQDYSDLVPMGADSFSAAVGNSVLATFFFVIAWVICIPLWLIPGLSLILPVTLMAWYNRRTFAYDALSLHATPEEWRKIKKENQRSFFLVGLLMAILAHVPLLGLLVPTVTALMFVHYCLEVLRKERFGVPEVMRGQTILDGEFKVEAE